MYKILKDPSKTRYLSVTNQTPYHLTTTLNSCWLLKRDLQLISDNSEPTPKL